MIEEVGVTSAEVKQLLELGITGLLLIALLAGARRWWVFGWKYQEVARERDAWREIALRGLGVAEQILAKLQRDEGVS